jgi:hypothetical protein
MLKAINFFCLWILELLLLLLLLLVLLVLLLLVLLVLLLLQEGVGVITAKGSWRWCGKELMLCQPTEPRSWNRFQSFLSFLSFSLFFSFLKLSSKKKIKIQWPPLAIVVQQCRNPTLGLSVRMQITLPKVGKWSPPGLPKTPKTIWGVKSPHIGAFFISMERSWSVYAQNGLAWAIWTSAAQIMGKRRVGSQIASLTPDH